MSTVPLRRNRDFLLLQAALMLSALGGQMTTIAYPLLVLAVTHSPAKVGLVAFLNFLPHAFFSVLAGVAADRWNRKTLMIATHAVRLVAVGSIAVTILLGRISLWQIVVVSIVEGMGSVLFRAAQGGALRAVVPARQLPDAVSTEVARVATVSLAGPPLGGILFSVGRAVPFVADAVSYACSAATILAMRTPFQEKRAPDTSKLRAQIAEGFRFLWSQPFIRTCALLFGFGNFIFPGMLIVLVVVGKRDGLSGGEIGALTAIFGAALLVGSLISPLVRRALSVRAILLLELWTWTASFLFLIWPNVYVLALSTVPQALTIPSTDSVVHAYRTAMTPDRLIGRVNGAASNISLLVAPLGPLAAGLLLSSVSARATVAVFTAAGVVLAVWGTLSPSIRRAPSLAELDDLPVPLSEVSPATTATS
jgi:MFS family permease